MKLLEFLETLSLTNGDGKGTFVAARLTKDSEKKLLHWMRENKISKPVPRKDLHVTVVLDKNKEFDWPAVKFEPPLEITADSYKIEKFGKDGSVLVLSFSQSELEQRHAKGREEYQIDWDFPSYQPHVTLSYDSDVDPKDILLPTFSLFLEEEYVEPFETDDDNDGVTESILTEVTPYYRITNDMIRNAASHSAQFIVEMPPSEFLTLTMPESSREEVESRALSLLRYNRMAKSGDIDVMPNLTILVRSERFGVVRGHEGRARALSMIKAGLRMMPVAIELRVDNQSGFDTALDRKNPNNRRLQIVSTKYKLNYDDLPKVVKGEFEGTDAVLTKNWFLKVPDLQKHLLPNNLNESLILTEKIITNREEVMHYAGKWANMMMTRIPVIMRTFPHLESWFKRNLFKMAMDKLYPIETFKLIKGKNESGKIFAINQSSSGSDVKIFNNEREMIDHFSPLVAKALLNGETVYTLNTTHLEHVIEANEMNNVLDYIRHLHNNNPRILEKHRLDRITLTQMIEASTRWHEELIKSAGLDASDKLGMADYQTREEVQLFADGYGWYVLPTEACLRREGNMMGHCVGDYHSDTIEGDKIIVSLRSRDNKPHVTMALDRQKTGKTFKIVEVKGKSNEVPHSKYRKYIDAFIARFVDSLEEEPFVIEFPDSVILEDQRHMNPDLLGLGYLSLPNGILRLPEGEQYMNKIRVKVNSNDPEAKQDIEFHKNLPYICWYVARLGRSFVYGSTDNPDDLLYQILTDGYYRKEYKGRLFIEDDNDSFIELRIDNTNHNFIKVL